MEIEKKIGLELAKSTYDHAVEFFYAFGLLGVSNTVFSERNKQVTLIIPAIVNGAFACELFLKCILDYKQIDYRSSYNRERKDNKELSLHKLDYLFSFLPEDMRHTIIGNFSNYDYDEVSFERELKMAANAFELYRYINEKSGMFFLNVVFLEIFARQLETICHNLIKEDVPND